MSSIIAVPLNKLTCSARNVRKSGGDSIDDDGIDAALPQLLATAPRSKDRLDSAWVAQSQRSTQAIAFSL